MLALTFDIEWSPDPIVDECMALVEKRNLPATLFCTDPATDRSGKSSSLVGRFSSRLELAIHPNFDHRGDYAAVFDSMAETYPNALGFRSHNCVNGWPITQEAQRRGMIYESNYLLYHKPMQPFPVHEKHLRFIQAPVYFMDAAMLSHGRFEWNTEAMHGLAEDPACLLVFDFHPVMLYYDCVSQADYAETKPYYHDPRPQLSFLHRSDLCGSMRWFRQLVDDFDGSSFTTVAAHCQPIADTAFGRLSASS